MTAEDFSEGKFDEGFEEPAKNIIKFNKPGDVIRGTLLGTDTFRGDYGECMNYTIKADAGTFYGGTKDAIDKTPTLLVKGEMYSFLGHVTIDDYLKQAKVGQVIVVRFVEWKESTQRKGAKYKLLKAKLGHMDVDEIGKVEEDIPFDK